MGARAMFARWRGSSVAPRSDGFFGGGVSPKSKSLMVATTVAASSRNRSVPKSVAHVVSVNPTNSRIRYAFLCADDVSHR